jgi:RNA polymerase sigma factor (sigma-70 family)
MSLQPEALKREIEKAIVSLTAGKGVDLATKIRQILDANQARKRVQKFVEDNPEAVEEYVNRIVENYELLGPYIHQLQIERSDKVWSLLLLDMRRWAYRFFIKKGCIENKATWENAKECANEAARNILKAHFPFDTDFDPWARVVVQNTCLKFLRNIAKDVPILEESLDNLDGILGSSNDAAFPAEHSELFEAISQLNNTRRQVIEMKYFQSMSPSEIAIKLGKSVRAVHSLQFHGLQELRKILTQNRNKLNE